MYRVSATWPQAGTNAVDTPYTISDGTDELGTVTVDQQSTLNDVYDAGTSWEDLGGPYTVFGNSLVVKLTDLAGGNVMADAVRIEHIAELNKLGGPEDDPANAHIPNVRLRPAVAEEFTLSGGISISRRTIAVVFSDTTTVAEANALLESVGATLAGGEPLINTLFLSLPDDGNLATTMETVQRFNARSWDRDRGSQRAGRIPRASSARGCPSLTRMDLGTGAWRRKQRARADSSAAGVESAILWPTVWRGRGRGRH